jgi:hypothetical protein
MSDNHSPPQRRREQTERLRTNPDHGREDAERDRGFAEEHMPAEAARNEAEQLRRLAEEAREQRDQDRGASSSEVVLRNGHRLSAVWMWKNL